MTVDRLIIFTRYPQPGKAKTRLIPALGATGAANFQRQMTEHTLTQVGELVQADSPLVEICYAASADAVSESDRQAMQEWLGFEWVYQPQSRGDLGDRMAQAFQMAFAAGMERVVTIGTDCPGLDATRLTQAFEILQTHELVLGTATDGGYYLIGLRRFVPELFVGIAWSTAEVLEQTIAIATQLNLKIAYLDPLTDIDRPENLTVWESVSQQIQNSNPPLSPQISIIIPTLNEAERIRTTLTCIQPCSTALLEVIVVDGGSVDQTVKLANQMGAKVICSAPGRAHQMNAGATIAAGEILLFLHADTRLPGEFMPLVQQALAKPNTIAGAFELQIEGTVPGLRLVEWGVKWRSRLLQLPYGDQAIFLKATTFRACGGFTDLPIMEDFELIRRLQTQGKIVIVPTAVLASGRRWQHLGVLRTTLMNQLVIIAYFLGISPELLARWYRGSKWTNHQKF